jgi:hypothetical protein
MNAKPSIRCSSVQVSADEIAEFDRKTKVRRIQKSDIIQITLKYGTAGEHFIGTIAAGLALGGLGVVLGIMPLVRIVLRGDYPQDSGYTLQGEAYAVPMVLIGLFLIRDLFKRRYYFRVKDHDRYYKVVFQDKISAAEVNDFVKRAESDLGYRIIREKSPNESIQPTS